ncbi:MAG: peptidoglycan-binding domain-containing protein [Nannocystales bacterium]
MPTHIVKAGESVISLSEDYGLYADTIWAAPENAALKAARPNMNTLLPGDELFIPELRVKEVTAPTGKLHTFRRKGIPAHFRIQLYDFGEPRADQDYTLEVGGTTIEGKSDADGVVKTALPAGATSGVLTIGEDRFVVQLAFGHLDPLCELSGVQQRLANLGYPCGRADGKMGPRTEDALVAFQRAQDAHLEATGELDDATRARLDELHDAVADDTLGQDDSDTGASA